MSSPPPEASRITRPRALAVAAACFTLVAVLGIGVFTDFGPQLDLDGAVSEAMYAGDDRAATLDVLLEVLTAPGGAAFRLAVLLSVVAILLLRRAYRTALWVAVALAGIGPLNTLLKALFGRIRPDFDEGGALLLSLSYPSGHSSGVATIVTVALLLVWPLVAWRWRATVLVVAAVLVALVGLTRMWLGVHFLSDVIGGWALGIGWTLLVATLLHGLPGERAALPRRDTAATG